MPTTFADPDDDEPRDSRDCEIESLLPDCLNCGMCFVCVQRSIDAYEADTDGRQTCLACDGSGIADKPLSTQICFHCKGTGYTS